MGAPSEEGFEAVARVGTNVSPRLKMFTLHRVLSR